MNKPHFQSLASRLSRWIISIGMVVFIAVLSANYSLSRFLLDDYVAELAKTTASSTVKEVETIFNRASSHADALASVVSSTHSTEQQIHQSIKAFLNTNDEIFGMTVALEANTLIKSPDDFAPYYYRDGDSLTYSNLADETYQYKKWQWYSEPKKLNKAIWSEPYLDEGGGNVLMTTYSTPIYASNDNSFIGIATADIQLKWLNAIIDDIKIGKTGYGFIVSKDDVIIAHPDKTFLMKKLLDILDQKVVAKNWQKYLHSKAQSASVYMYSNCRDREGNCWIAVEALGDTGWKVVIVQPEQELISAINALTIKIAIIAIAGLVILLLVITLITRHLTNPLGKLALVTKDIGKGDLNVELPTAARHDEIGTLTNDFGTMRDSLKIYISELEETTAKKQKLESEIQIAKDIQMSMIPGAGNVNISNEVYQLFSYLKPARSVGGDLYYYHESGDNFHFIVGDVSDKGVPAALFMAKTVTLYTRALKEELSPGKTFTMMNDILAENNDACMFVTALCGCINLSTGNIVMANAGHMDPIITDGSHTREQAIKGATALGLMDGVDYPDFEFTLSKQSSIVMYTDGISEAHDKDSNQYGDDTLIELVTNVDSNNSENLGKQIISSVETFAGETEQFDDITLFILRYL